MQRYAFIFVYLLLIGGAAAISIGLLSKVSGIVPVGGVIALVASIALAAKFTPRRSMDRPHQKCEFHRHRNF